jgi:hypothetical protein
LEIAAVNLSHGGVISGRLVGVEKKSHAFVGLALTSK